MNAVADYRILNYQIQAIEKAKEFVSYTERKLESHGLLTNYEKNVIRDFRMLLHEIEKIQKGRVK